MYGPAGTTSFGIPGLADEEADDDDSDVVPEHRGLCRKLLSERRSETPCGVTFILIIVRYRTAHGW